MRQGTVIRGTLRTEDLYPTLFELLEEVGGSVEDFPVELPDDEDYMWVADLMDDLTEFAPEGMYFGAHLGDGSDFGWWEHEDTGWESDVF